MTRSTMPRALFAAVLATLTAFAPTDAAADIVNVQPLLAPADDDGFAGELSGAMNWRTGNVDIFQARASVLMRYRAGMHRFISSSSYELGIKGGADFLDRVFTHLRHQWLLTETLTWETYTQLAADQFKRLQMRVLGGTGPRLEIVSGPAVSLAVALSYMVEHEKFGSGDYVDAGQTETNHRASSYVTGRFAIDPLLAVVHTTYFQPRLDAFADFRLLSQSGLSIKLSEGLGVLVGFTLAYDARPPATIDTLDTTMDVSFALKL